MAPQGRELYLAPKKSPTSHAISPTDVRMHSSDSDSLSSCASLCNNCKWYFPSIVSPITSILHSRKGQTFETQMFDHFQYLDMFVSHTLHREMKGLFTLQLISCVGMAQRWRIGNDHEGVIPCWTWNVLNVGWCSLYRWWGGIWYPLARSIPERGKKLLYIG